ncbi:MAG TPA: hypothetical protein PKD24_02440 [Pyrinomonadaceae bacterium]|nr:hypothetical protein [Pyrinomonadaceae bacterium]HMP63982.1 hypothetical protein [Pyrinomonadaceae bacterium]
MRNQILNKTRFAAMAVLMIFSIAVLGGRAKAQNIDVDPGKEMGPELINAGNQIEGTWDVRVNITVCATGATLLSFDAMGLFAANGTFHDTNATNPAVRSSGFGVWERVRGRDYRFAFKFFRFDTAENYQGYNVVRHNVRLNHGGSSYVSSGTAEFYDADGNLMMLGCSNSTATRFQ